MSRNKDNCVFVFNGRERNPEYESGLLDLHSLRSCLIHNNAEKIEPPKQGLKIKTKPKWVTTLQALEPDGESGELLPTFEYITNDLKAGNNRKIKALNSFCNHYQPLYQERKVSLLMHTFTQADRALLDMRRMIDDVKYRYKLIGKELRGYMWTMEISSENYHFHYHLVTACNRIRVKGGKMPDELKLEELWGQRTGVEFVRKNVKHYLSSYFSKNNYRIERKRMYGKSRRFF